MIAPAEDFESAVRNVQGPVVSRPGSGSESPSARSALPGASANPGLPLRSGLSELAELSARSGRRGLSELSELSERSGRRGLSELSGLEAAIVEAVAYADVFDWPLTPDEVHRYLPIAAPRDAVRRSLQAGPDRPLAEFVKVDEGFVALHGRTGLARRRRHLEAASNAAWPRAVRYGRVVAGLPFVRLVAITGSLALRASDENADVDLFVVTDDGRVWTARAMAMVAVRAASLRDVHLCPNYLLARSSLRLDERSLFTAHELAQMVPVVASPVYDELLSENAWYREFLPNAGPRPEATAMTPGRIARGSRALLRWPLETRLGERLERWEMERKVRRLSRESRSAETRYDATCCKGHATAHGRRAMAAFEARMRDLARPQPATRILTEAI